MTYALIMNSITVHDMTEVVVYNSTDAHLPCLAEPAHRWVAHPHDDREEGVQVPVLFTAAGKTGAQSY